MTGFGADEIRIAETVERAIAHLSVACELYGMGRKADALLQAARPITDIVPALETELRSADESLNAFFTATARVGAEIRANAKPRAVRRALKDADKAAVELLASVLGEVVTPSEPRFRSSVGIALLAGAPNRYRNAVEEEDLGDYQAAFAIAHRASEVIWSAHDGRIEKLNELVSALTALLPAAEPPEKLPRPDAVETLVEGISAVVIEDLGASMVTWTLEDSVKRMERLVADVVDAYDRDLGPLAARLSSNLFVRVYDPIRHDIAAVEPDIEARLTSLLGFELRRAINDLVPADHIRELTAEAGDLLATLRTQAATKRDTPLELG